MASTKLNRRTFLRGIGGIALALPTLEVMANSGSKKVIDKKMVCIGTNFGFVPSEFFPAAVGENYPLSPLLAPLKAQRKQFTVFSGLDHGANGIGGHMGVHAFLSGVLSTRAKSYKDGNITIDQVAALHSGAETRYPSLQLSMGSTPSNLLSWSRGGISLPPIEKLTNLFKLLFINDTSHSYEVMEKLQEEQISILDLVNTDAKRLQNKISSADKIKIDEYFTSVRELEKRLLQSKKWIRTAKPQVDYELVSRVDDLEFIDRAPIYYDLIALALETDSTRAITLEISDIGKNLGGLPINRGYHSLTHHGKVESYLTELHKIELFHTTTFAKFIKKLGNIQQVDGSSLLDNTMVLLGSGMGNAASHSNKSIPLLLAGGGFKHGQHLSYNSNSSKFNNMQVNNLYVSMLQNFGIESDEFNQVKSRLSGLELA